MSMFHELMMKKKGMPSNYQEVEYIESTGTQYIDTGYVVQEDDIIETDAQQMGVSDNGDKFLFGQQSVDSSKGGTWIEQYGPNNNYYVRFGSLASANQSYGATTKVHYTLKKGRFISSEGVSLSLGFDSLQSTNLTLFGRFSADGTTFAYSKYKMWTFYITRNGRLVRNFIPVYDTLTQKYGMWESVQGKFYGNDGTGDFKGSIVGYTVVGSPTITDGVVSGFSASDYLTINNANVFAQSDSWEIMIKKSGVLSGYLFGTNKQYAITFTQKVIYLSSNGSSWDIASNAGVGQSPDDCFLRIRFTGTQYIYDYSIDKVNWTTLATVNSSSKITNLVQSLQIGHWVTSYYATGSIDLNNTYIKINNKLWFNGQQA